MARLDRKLVFVNAFGSYFDTTDFVRAISTRSQDRIAIFWNANCASSKPLLT